MTNQESGEFTPEQLAAMDTPDVIALLRRNSGDPNFYWRVREAVLNRAADEITRLAGERFTLLAASKMRAAAEPSADSGFREAFWRIAELLDLPAMPASPKVAFETEMLPLLRRLVAQNMGAESKAEHAVHDAITRALAEAGVKQEMLVGMCIEVGLEAYRDAVNRKGDV